MNSLDDRKWAEWERLFARARGHERDRLIVVALCWIMRMPRPMPRWLKEGVLDCRKLSPDWLRWAWARVALEFGTLPWEETYEKVSEMLTDIGRRASADTIRKSYEKIERSLP